MNICILQHVPFEGPGTILPFFEGSVHRIKMIHLYKGQALPSSNWPDFLVVMGGPMGVGDEEHHPWLQDEKKFIGEVIHSGAWVLGICLGAQLIATALGADVTKNKATEIGWFPIQLDPQLETSWLQEIFGAEFEALHWHGDTFALPQGAQRFGSSEACENQGFIWNTRVIGLQFHLEFTPESTAILAEKCAQELVDARWIQTAEEMLSRRNEFAIGNTRMANVLAHIEAQITSDVSLHPQLEKDCIQIGETKMLWVLLHSNATIPWFILVPKGRFRDLDELTEASRTHLLNCSDRISNLLRNHFGSEKINVGALGNMVPQLHLHVIGRTSRDPCWPNPVWGYLSETRDWHADELAELEKLVETALS